AAYSGSQAMTNATRAATRPTSSMSTIAEAIDDREPASRRTATRQPANEPMATAIGTSNTDIGKGPTLTIILLRARSIRCRNSSAPAHGTAAVPAARTRVSRPLPPAACSWRNLAAAAAAVAGGLADLHAPQFRALLEVIPGEEAMEVRLELPVQRRRIVIVDQFQRAS